MSESRRFCRKCLLRDMKEEDVMQGVLRAIERIPEEDRVPETVYEERLASCRNCEELLDGMCRICGCYVEMRAMLTEKDCPAIPAKWGYYREKGEM